MVFNCLLLTFSKNPTTLAQGKSPSCATEYTKWSPKVRSNTSESCTPRLRPYLTLDWLGTSPVTNKVDIKLTNLPKRFGLLHYATQISKFLVFQFSPLNFSFYVFLFWSYSIQYICWFCVIDLMKVKNDRNEQKKYFMRRTPFVVSVWSNVF